ncbi:hypothetical protein IRP63_14445 (plasmid) [Clostridium botulinum]|uniref:Uncharacterized protein n=1 Tax=Clostridium botulinum C/D str. DC5 TaxID=1443128 RepID=A0A0A0HXQ7_CLOBO|nr:hypothetical protein [Clostridium botulinum]KGM93307.1 hypothetical protein Z955_15115 [Clostridium botulinum C/D str. DC5]KOC56822.1 hypothetical protein ADU89_01035 [Clostridium botulinum]KOC57297.1 hypothetical protein ADU90_05575 [Clostridium botulinum]MCD3232516.1 hypothetical protein [Clostridium botulinum D/C]MCD3238555.1 hypothetical protein [Clostridium botulinum D/C]
MDKKKYSNEELIQELQKVYNKCGYISTNSIDTFGKYKSYLYTRRFGSLSNAMSLIGVDIERNNIIKSKYSSQGSKRKYTREQLLHALRKYYNEVGFPIQRKFKAIDGLPSYTLYHTEFGSFKNAILISGIKIPKSRECYFNRSKLTNKELLSLLKYYTEIKLKHNGISLLTNDEIDYIQEMPSSSAYCNRFGGIVEAYKLININYYTYNHDLLIEDMKQKYEKIKNIIGRTPNSRDLDSFSQKESKYYSSSTYINHFGNISNLQKVMGDIPTILGKSITYEELVDKIYRLKEEIGDIPTQNDIDECEYLPSTTCIIRTFGSIREMQLKLFDKTYSKIKVTCNGTICNSSYEYKVAKVLENNNIPFEKEELYKNYIENFNKGYKFDFTIIYDNKKYFIEVFGITGIKDYKTKTKEKIQLCKNNKLPLIELYPQDLWDKSYEEIKQNILTQIHQLDGFFIYKN